MKIDMQQSKQQFVDIYLYLRLRSPIVWLHLTFCTIQKKEVCVFGCLPWGGMAGGNRPTAEQL
jgi:hypothetical protein